MALSNVRWKGLKAIEVMAKTLPTKIAGQKLREAYKYALTPVRDDMRNLIPVQTGALWHATDITIAGNSNIESTKGVVGPRRRRGVWNMRGWHAHKIEKGTKPHDITAGPGKLMPVFNKSGFTGQFAKTIRHPGSRAFKPFSRAIDANWEKVGSRVSDKVSEIMRKEIDDIWTKYGNVATKDDL